MKNGIPTLMTFEEVWRGWQDCPNRGEGFWVWLEVKKEWYIYHFRVYTGAGGFFGESPAIAFDIPEDTLQYDVEDYGKTWRVWTDKPSYELRKATPWEE